MKRFLSFFGVMLFCVVSAVAQVTTSGITGKVTTEGEAVIGATIQAVHVPSGTHYGTTTNLNGRFDIQGMRAGGPYKVEISYVGYETKVYNELYLQLGEALTLKVNLKEDSKELNEIVVVGRSGLDANKTGAAMSINAKQIQNMPSISHSIADITRLNPQINVSQSGAMTFAGASNRYNSFQVDGAMNNDVFGLTSNGQNGGQAGSQPISLETIDQIQVNVAPFDVRQSGFTGGSINAITKSGTNEFHGSLYGDWNNQNLIGSKYKMMNGKNSEKYEEQQEYHFGATIGGPIIKDKLFFFANFEKANKTYPNKYGYRSSASKLTPSGANGVDGWEVVDQIINFITESSSKQRYTYIPSLANPDIYQKSTKAGLKLDWNINDKHKAMVSWRLNDAKQLNGGSNASTFKAADQQYDFVSNTNTFTAELQSRFSQSVANELRVSYVRVRDHRDPIAAAPMIQISGVGNGTFAAGTEYSSAANALDQDTYTFTDNFTLYKGNHTFTFGTHNEFYNFKNLFIQNYYGCYYFNSPDDFYGFANGDYTKLKQYYYTCANEAVTGDPHWAAEFGAGQLGFYVQDKWDVTDNFQLTYGLRADVPLCFDTPTENPTFNNYAKSMYDKYGEIAANYSNLAAQAYNAGDIEAANAYDRQWYETDQIRQRWDCKTNQKMSSAPMWSPRIGFRWKLDDASKYVLRGGAGVFTGRIPFVWLSNNISNTGIQLNSYSTNAGVNGMTLIWNPNAQKPNTEVLKASGSQLINVFDKNFRFSQNARFSLGFDFRAAGIDWTFDGIYSKTLNDVVYRNLAYDLDGKTVAETYPSLSFDNRPTFARQTTKALAGAEASNITNIYHLGNTSQGYSYSLSLKAAKSFAFGLDLSASYTYTQSKSVNSGTNSVAQSNFRYNYTHGNSNEPELGYSAYNIPHKIVISAFYNKEYAKHWNTTVGLIYTGSTGAPYSVYYYGDLNGDGADGNDLMFIPTDAQIDQMQFKSNAKFDNNGKKISGYTAEEQATNMKQWLASDDYLSKHRGEYFERYAANDPFEHHFDFHFAQGFKFNTGKYVHKFELSVDILNIGNMFNKEWGRYSSAAGSASYYSPVTYAKNGQFQFLHDGDYNMHSYSDYYSRWRGQIGLKYTF